MAQQCGICDHILSTCKKLGDKSYCKKLIDKLEGGDISETEFNKKLNKKFGKKAFDRIWNE